MLKCIGFDMCLRDDEGRFVLVRTLWSQPICSMEIGGAFGIVACHQLSA